MGAQQINNSRTLCYSFQPHANPDLRSTEPTQITPFLGNFPDPTLSLPTRTGNALILGLDQIRFWPLARRMAQMQFSVVFSRRADSARVGILDCGRKVLDYTNFRPCPLSLRSSS